MKKSINNFEVNKKETKKASTRPFYFFSWIIKVECIIILIILAIFLIYKIIPKTVKNKMKYNIGKMSISNIDNTNYSYDNIIDALDSNKYLEKEDKEFIKTYLRNEIEENKEFIDLKLCSNRFKKLQIAYNSNSKVNKYKLYEVDAKMSVAGSYNGIFNKMNIQCDLESNDKLSFANCDKESYFHELNHVISRSTLKMPLKINILAETINELFTREYYEQYLQDNNINIYVTNGYENYMRYAYALTNLLPEDVIRKYKFNNNESILITGLLQIDDNIDEAYKLIDSINSIKINETNSDKSKENYKNIHDSFAYFYEKKNKRDIKNDIELLLYFYNSPVQTEEERKIIRDLLQMNNNDEIDNVFAKGYMSEEYKAMHDKIIIELEKNGKKEFVGL